MTFYKHEPSFIISNDGTQKGPGYVSSYDYHDDYYYGDNYYEEYVLGAFHHIQWGFFSFIWKSSLFLVSGDGNIYRLTNEGKL